MTVVSAAALPSPYAPFRFADYRLFVVMVLLTQVAQQAQGVAIGWDIYERTGSALALGWVGLVQFLPVLLFFLPAGQWADRHDRRGVAAVSLVVWCAAAALLALSARLHASLIWLYPAVAATVMGNVVNRAARDALLPQLVPIEAFGRAVTWNSIVTQSAAVAGPALAGLLIALGGSAFTVYAADFCCILLALAVTLMIRPRAPSGGRRPSSWGEVFGGLAHIWRSKAVLGVMTIDLFAVLLGGATAMLPLFAKDILHVGPGGLGWLSAAPAAGAVLMGFVQGHRKPYAHAGRTFLWAVGVFGLANVIFGLSHNFWLSLFMLIVVGASDNVGAVIRQTVVQLHTPDELRGRVSAANRVFISSSNELGALRAGIQTSLTGPVAAVLAGGVVTMLVAACGIKVFPALGKLKKVDSHGAG